MAVVKTQFTLRLDVAVHAKIKRIAEAESRSLTNMIEYLVKREIAAHEAHNGAIELTEDELSLE